MNRLRTGSTTTTVAEYVYNGLHHRIEKKADTSSPFQGSTDQVRRMYYSASWQLLQEDVDDSQSGDFFATDRVIQTLWGGGTSTMWSFAGMTTTPRR